MRTQYCREHIKKTAEECGLGPDIVSEVERVAKFCASNPTFADCATRPLRLLIDVRDEKIKNHAISLAENALKEETPTGGRKKKLLTETDVRGIIRKSEKEIRGELTEKYKAEKKPEPAKEPETPAPVQIDGMGREIKARLTTCEEPAGGCRTLAQVEAGVPATEPPVHRPPPCLGGSGCTHKMFEPTYRTCGYNGGAKHIAAIKTCPFDEEQPADTPATIPASASSPFKTALQVKNGIAGEMFPDKEGSDARVKEPTPEEKRQVEKILRNELAEKLLALYPGSMQVMMADILREHTSWKTADAFYFGIEALGEKMQHGRV
jgi:hypothetical protein